MTTTRRDPLAARTAQPAVLASEGKETTKIDHALIRIDGGTQMRAGLNEATIAEYAEAIEAGALFPALTVFYDGTAYWLGDGFHRLEAMRLVCKRMKVFLSEVVVEVRPGTRRDAILYAAAANATHGLRRTPEDKRRAVETLLRDDEWHGWSDREIARRCHVSHPFVSKVRGDVAPVHTGNVTSMKEERTFVHHKTGEPTTMRTGKIGATKPAPPRLLSEAEARAVILEVAYAAGSNPAQRCEWLENHHGLSHFTKTMTGAVNIDNRAFEAAYESAMLDLSERTAPPNAAPAVVGKCRVCHRPLTDPASVGDACGPTCAARLAAQGSADDAPALTKADIDRGGPTVCPHDLAAAGWALHETKRVGMSSGWSMENYQTGAATEMVDDPEYAIGQAYVKQRGFADAPASDAGRAKQFRIKGEIMHWREALRHLETVGELTGRHTLALPARRAIEDVIAAYEGMVVE